jgi:APA family basic amino acid/polyamine antiporter
VAAIVLQGVTASVIALSGRFDQILNYVVSIDVLFFGLTAATLFVFRRRDPTAAAAVRAPLHPISTVLFVAVVWAIGATTVISAPTNAGIGVIILLIGVPVFFWWSKSRGADASMPLE